MHFYWPDLRIRLLPLINQRTMKQRFKNYVNDSLEKLTGMRLQNTRIHGRQDWLDIKNSNKPINIILDIGANVGQSAIKFHHAFPQASIHCFEPVTHLNLQLEENVKQFSNIYVYADALGAAAAKSQIYLTTHETTSSLIKPDYVKETQNVNVITVDEFLKSENISHVGLLKIDVEGLDLDVLKGAKATLEEKKVDFILVECGFYNDAPHPVSIDIIRDYLLQFGYRIFGIYDQQLAWSNSLELDYVNACFVAN